MGQAGSLSHRSLLAMALLGLLTSEQFHYHLGNRQRSCEHCHTLTTAKIILPAVV